MRILAKDLALILFDENHPSAYPSIKLESHTHLLLCLDLTHVETHQNQNNQI